MEALVVSGVIGLFGAAVALGLRQNKRRKELWARVAAERGGQHIAPRGLFRGREERIEIPTPHSWISIDWYSSGSGNSTTHYSRARASLARGAGPRFKIYKEHLFASLGKALGTQDVVIGSDAEFDDLFMVKCDQAPLLRRFWTPTAMRIMRNRFRGARIECDGRTVELVDTGLWNEEGPLHGAIDLLTELAERDIYERAALESVRGATVRLSADGVPRAELDAPSRVVIGAEPVGETLATVARLADDAGLEAIELVLDGHGRPDDRERASALPQGAHVFMPRVGAGRLVVEEGATRFEFPGLEIDSDRLRASAELLGAIRAASARAGVFR